MHLVTRLLTLDCDVHLVTSRESLESEEFAQHLGNVRGNISCVGLDGFALRPGGRGISVNGPAGNFALMKGLYQGIQSVRPDHVYIPFGNPISHWAGLPNPVSRLLRSDRIESELVLLFGKYAYRHRGVRAQIKEWLALSVLARGPWTRVHHIVPRAIRVMSAYSQKLQSISRLLPDPVETPPEMSRHDARAILGLPQSGRVLSLVGLIEPRKGVFELLEAFSAALPQLEPSDCLLLAGKSTEEVRAVLQSRYQHLLDSRRIVSIDRHLSEQELWASCIGASVVCTPYPHHRYSASIVIRAAAAGVPVLANAIGWMDETIPKFSLGTTCNTNDSTEFSQAIQNALNASQHFALKEDAMRFVAFHSAYNFSSHLTARIAERMNKPTPRTQLLPWPESKSDRIAA
jgi:glycosyltransferase involved in cell wall biosynthesis